MPPSQNADHRIKGTLKLEYDVTPRDSDHFQNLTPKDYVDASNFRFRGYPEGKFEKARDAPLPSSGFIKKIDQPLEKNFHLPNYLDSNKPKVFDNAEGFQYGSENLPLSHQEPRPVRDPFNEKSSAELAKYRETQAEVELEIAAFKQEKQMKTQERESEKKKDLEMLRAYHPWGKPGAGAPIAGKGEPHKKHNISDDNLYNSPRDPVPRQKDLINEYGDFHGKFGQPGHGAPLKDENTGKMKTEIKGAADIRFLDTKGGRKVYERELRYQKPGTEKYNYYKELDQQANDKNLQKGDKEARLQNLRQELENMQNSNPFGKPGAGAPNKTQSGHMNAARKTTLTKDQQEQQRIDEKGFDKVRSSQPPMDEDFGVFDPWGKGAMQPNRNKLGEPARHRNADRGIGVYTQDKSNYEKSLELKKTGGGGAPVTSRDGGLQAKFPVTLERNDKGDSTIIEDHPRAGPRAMPDDPELQIYDPFGKGGGGAPLKSNSGKVITQVYGKLENGGMPVSSASAKQKQYQAQSYLYELRREMDEQKRNKEAEKSMGRVEAGDLTEVLRKGQVGKPKRDPVTGELLRQSLNMSDVTIEKTDTRKLKSKESPAYLTDLERAALERKRNQELDKLKEKQETKYHAAQMNNFWGKPGGGAPRATGTKVSHLNTIINSPRTMSPEYNRHKTIEEMKKHEDAVNKHHIRGTTHGSSSNQYEMAKPLKREPKANYNLMAPYASEPGEVF